MCQLLEIPWPAKSYMVWPLGMFLTSHPNILCSTCPLPLCPSHNSHLVAPSVHQCSQGLWTHSASSRNTLPRWLPSSLPLVLSSDIIASRRVLCSLHLREHCLTSIPLALSLILLHLSSFSTTQVGTHLFIYLLSISFHWAYVPWKLSLDFVHYFSHVWRCAWHITDTK